MNDKERAATADKIERARNELLAWFFGAGNTALAVGTSLAVLLEL